MEETPPSERVPQEKVTPGRLAVAILLMAVLVVGAQVLINWRFQEPPVPPLPEWYLEMKKGGG